jgi:hypothetical protein
MAQADARRSPTIPGWRVTRVDGHRNRLVRVCSQRGLPAGVPTEDVGRTQRAHARYCGPSGPPPLFTFSALGLGWLALQLALGLLSPISHAGKRLAAVSQFGIGRG